MTRVRSAALTVFVDVELDPPGQFDHAGRPHFVRRVTAHVTNRNLDYVAQGHPKLPNGTLSKGSVPAPYGWNPGADVETLVREAATAAVQNWSQDKS